MKEEWSNVDDYIEHTLFPPDPVLEESLRESASAGLPRIQVSPAQGMLLHVCARIRGARRILEVGTLGGYSTIWLGRALPPDGRLVSLEMNPVHADVARRNLERAGLSDRVEVRVGNAAELLPEMVRRGEGPFDLTFIDADKGGYPVYLEWAVSLSRPGSAIIADNVVRGGAVADPASSDPNVVGVRAFHESVASNPRLAATVIQTVGQKGWDGFLLAVVLP